jgi:hypothetical protein
MTLILFELPKAANTRRRPRHAVHFIPSVSRRGATAVAPARFNGCVS